MYLLLFFWSVMF
uniref:Uncharacterized protein n=1 Tax=Anguilla anguilla TaxID=7936 RepID=A0A0E9TAL3_ANGAN